MRTLVCGVAILTALCSASPALAYKAARIGSDQAEIKDSPSADAGTITVISKGVRVNTSDQPTNGYYRVRSATDSGWIQESDLDFMAPTKASPRSNHPVKERLEDRDQETADHSSHSWIVKVFGGLDFWTPTDVNNLVGSTALSNGGGFGGELDYGLSKNFFLGFRIEKLTKNSSGPAGSGGTQDQVTLSLASTPVMAGIGWVAAKGDNFSLDIGAYAGLGFSTGVTETDTSQAAPNITSMVATAPTVLLAADINWHLTEPFWVYVEPGYRYLKTAQNNLTTVGNGSGLFTSNGQYVPFAVDMSGLLVNFGIRINF